MPERKPQQYRSKNSQVVAAERRRTALGLRRNGATYYMIAEALSISESRARTYVKEAIEAINEETAETAAELRTLELERLDRMLRILEGKVEAAAAEGDYRPMQMQLKVQERRSRLMGLDKPTKVDHSGRISVDHGISREEIDDLEKMWRREGYEQIDIPDAEVIPDEEPLGIESAEG